MGRRIAIATLVLLAAGLAVTALTHSSTPRRRSTRTPAERTQSAELAPSAATGGTLTGPIDTRYLTELPFGRSSFWIQPWRAYLDTWPASRLLDALGINFDVGAAEAQGVARLLHDSGFKLARIGINWSSLSYEDPTRFVDGADLRTRLLALHEYGLRPLILLDANSTAPCPAKRLTLDTVAPAPVGATTVTLDAASAAEVVPGKTGFDAVVFASSKRVRGRHGRHGKRTKSAIELTPAQRLERREARRAETSAGLTALVREGNPAILITKVSATHVATLSRPLPVAMAAGEHKATTLLYAPFGAPTLPAGGPNPAFQATLSGWLSYVATVSREAQSIFGPGGYDLEVWNELTFGSQFLNAELYYAPTGERKRHTVTSEVTKALLDATVAYVRDPAHGISPGVGVTDGFADQTPFPSGARIPGLTALSKHLYVGAKSFPADFRVGHGNVPLNALGERDTVGSRRSAGGLTPRFVPHFQALLPEYFLTALQTATIVRDLAPFTSYIYGLPHGRYVGEPTPPQVWMTEYNLSPAKATVLGPDESTPATGPAAQLTPADRAHFQAKALLRSLVAMVSKGMTREYLFHAAPGALSLINENFSTALAAHPTTYPGDAAGGETMSAFHNLLTHFQGPGPTGPPRQLHLLSITQTGNHAQFTGDGTPAHPNLYDREMLAVFPFQASPTRYVIPIYVMTLNLLTLYQPTAPTTDTHRFDLPPETFHITLTNLPPTTTPPTITAYDPLLNETTPTHLTTYTPGTATIEIAATDYPRLLTINYPSGTAAHAHSSPPAHG